MWFPRQFIKTVQVTEEMGSWMCMGEPKERGDDGLEIMTDPKAKRAL